MKPRFGRLYAHAVLRPLAEQVVDAIEVRPGATVCDLMCDGGTLGVALGRAVGSAGDVVLVDDDGVLLEDALRDVFDTGCDASTLLATGGTCALADSSCDRVGSLCTFGFWEGESMLDIAERATRPTGRAAVLAWDPAHPPAHEAALVDALRDAGIHSRFLERCLASPNPARAPRWKAVTLHDVARFDGIAHYWAAMVDERPIAADLIRESDAARRAIRAACRRGLEAYTAADETMRIPITATLWCFGDAARD